MGRSLAFADCVAVIYPDVREPYRRVLFETVSAIENDYAGTVVKLEIPDNVETQPANLPATAQACDALVGLGRIGEQFAGVPGQQRRAVGAVLRQPSERTLAPTLSLVPDPAELFLRLKFFAPKVTRVRTIFNPTVSQSLVDEGTRAANAHGLTLVSDTASTLRGALIIYKQWFNEMVPETEALWLLQDPSTVDNDVILPMILEASWKQRIVVFSNQPAHVNRGVLFSVYPNNVSIGQQLVKMVSPCVNPGCPENRVYLLRELYTAVHTKTAARLGISVQPGGRFTDLLFPNK